MFGWRATNPNGIYDRTNNVIFVMIAVSHLIIMNWTNNGEASFHGQKYDRFGMGGNGL